MVVDLGIFTLLLSTLFFLLLSTSFRRTPHYHINAESPISSISNSFLDPKGPQVQFILFTRDYSSYNLRVGSREEFEISGFNLTNPTKIITHGYASSIQDEIVTLIKDAYLNTEDCNIIGMDWSRLSEPFYTMARLNAFQAGYGLGDLLNFLVDDCNVDPKDIHLIGHSLGAHVMGIGANRLKNGSIARITGLDPASPGFQDTQYEKYLDSGDADLVDVIHTFSRALSLVKPIGHVDFYPNGGRYQPGCPNIYDILKLEESMMCHHGRSYMYFAESILNKRAFKSQRCPTVEYAIQQNCVEDTEVYMGQAETYEPGIYYVKTNSRPPFSIT